MGCEWHFQVCPELRCDRAAEGGAREGHDAGEAETAGQGAACLPAQCVRQGLHHGPRPCPRSAWSVLLAEACACCHADISALERLRLVHARMRCITVPATPSKRLVPFSYLRFGSAHTLFHAVNYSVRTPSQPRRPGMLMCRASKGTWQRASTGGFRAASAEPDAEWRGGP